MKVYVRVGRKEGFISSYNLFFENGLHLKTDDLTWLGETNKQRIETQFLDVVKTLKDTNWTVEGEIS